MNLGSIADIRCFIKFPNQAFTLHSANEDNYCLTFADDDVAEVTPVDKDTIINDMAAVVENMYIVNSEILRQGLYKTDVYTSRLDLTGCDTFTDILPKRGIRHYFMCSKLHGFSCLCAADGGFEDLDDEDVVLQG